MLRASLVVWVRVRAQAQVSRGAHGRQRWRPQAWWPTALGTCSAANQRPLGKLAALHHERLDGSGYPRGLLGDAISPAGRVLAAADVYQALNESRPHRPARTPEAAASELRGEVAARRLDGDAADAVLRAAGHRVRRRKEWPSGLTSRELEVLRLAARGLSNKEIARSLLISSKTTGTHVEHIYTKIGVSNRAQASLFAMKHGLMTDSGPETWPPERPPQRSGERPM